MLDFWETMGRVIADERGLADQLFKDPQLAVPNNPVLCAPGAKAPVAIHIDTRKYARLVSILGDHVHFQPFSLFGLSEWLRVLPSMSIKQDFHKLPRKGLPLKRRIPLFYACLGAIAVDDSFAQDYAQDPGRFPLLPRKTYPGEVEDLIKLADLSPGGLADSVSVLCAKHWPDPCHVVVNAYPIPAQLHPTLEGIPFDGSRFPKRQSS